MELEILKNEEKRMNMIMFLFLVAIPVVAVVYVLLFNGASGRDAIALLMVAASVLIKVFERSWVLLQNIFIYRFFRFSVR